MSQNQDLKIFENYKTLEASTSAIIIRKFYKSVLPKVVEYQDVYFNNIKMADCVETTIRNLCNIIAYDVKTGLLDISPLTNCDFKLKTFYASSTNKNADNIGDNKVHQAWVYVVQDRKFISYYNLIDKATKATVTNPPRGYEGFVAGLTIPQDVKETVSVRFNNGVITQLPVVTVGKTKYIVFDQTKYAGYEVNTQLRFIITMLNQLLGLKLYDNENTAFFKQDFCATYFPLLCKKLGWRFDSDDKQQLDTQREITLDLEKNGAKFSINLLPSHAYTQATSSSKIDDWQVDFFDNSYEALNKDTEHKNSYERLIEIFALFAPQKMYFDNAQYFIKSNAIKLYLYLLKDLSDGQTKCDATVAILNDKKANNNLYNLAATLINKMPVMSDLVYQTKIAKAIFDNNAHSKNSNLKASLEKMIKHISNMNTSVSTLNFFQYLAENDTAFKEATKAAIKSITSTNLLIRKASIEVLIKLVEKNQALKEASGAAYKNIQHSNENIRAASTRLFTELTQQGKEYEKAILVACTGIIDKHKIVRIASVELFATLFSKRKGFKDALNIIKQYSQEYSYSKEEILALRQVFIAKSGKN